MAVVKKEFFAGLIDEPEAPYVYRQRNLNAVDVKDGGIHVEYGSWLDTLPFQSSDCFTSFAKLAAYGQPSEAKVERWVSRFGLPVRGDAKPKRMSLEDFRSEARRAHFLLGIYTDLRSGDASKLRKRSKKRSPGVEAEFAERFEAMRREFPSETIALMIEEGLPEGATYRAAKDQAVLMAARIAFGDILTELLSGVRLRVGIQENLTHSYSAPDLISAIYLQFYLLATQQRPVKACEYCGQTFEATRRDRGTCSDSCRSGLNKMRRKKSRSEGDS